MNPKALIWTEHDHQRAVVDWANRMSGLVPELQLLFAVPNGGFRHVSVARKMKAEGVKAGVPDLVLPIPRARANGGHWNGLFVELKTPTGTLSIEQRKWIVALRSQDYKVEVAKGFEQAIHIIEDYLGIRHG